MRAAVSAWGQKMATTGKRATVAASDMDGVPSTHDINDSYLYLLGRLLVLRQEHFELSDKRFEWNTVIHSEAGCLTWPSHRDVAFTEAWIAVDEHTCTLVDIPDLVGRYYTIQLVNPWGETIANINERTFPTHPTGPFLICMKDARVTLPSDSNTARVNLPGRKARLLIQLEHGADRAEAIALQRRIRVRATGTGRIAAPVQIAPFTNEALPGVEAFDAALPVLASEPDLNPGAEALQAKVRAVVEAAASSPGERSRIDSIVRHHAWRALRKHVAARGVFANGWFRPRAAGQYGNDWVTRTVANFTRIWSNMHTEMMQFENGSVLPLSGEETYTIRFPKNDLPDSHVTYFWSLTCLGADERSDGGTRAVINQRSKLHYESDGSLTLFLSAMKPHDVPEENWLATPRGHYLATWRSYGPDRPTLAGQWFPPPIQKRRFRRA